MLPFPIRYLFIGLAFFFFGWFAHRSAQPVPVPPVVDTVYVTDTVRVGPAHSDTITINPRKHCDPFHPKGGCVPAGKR